MEEVLSEFARLYGQAMGKKLDDEIIMDGIIINAFEERMSAKNKDGSLQKRDDESWHLQGWAFKQGWHECEKWLNKEGNQ